jgi:hypothetical protein
MSLLSHPVESEVELRCIWPQRFDELTGLGIVMSRTNRLKAVTQDLKVVGYLL